MTQKGALRTGVLGCGSIAWRRTIPALCASSHAEVVAVSSRDPRKARRFAEHFGCAAANSYHELLSSNDIDAVYVAVPTGLHAEWAAKAIEQGKHVLVEKPMAATHRQAQWLSDLAAKAGVVLMENRMFVHHPQHEEVRKLMQAGAIGELRVLTASMGIPPLNGDDIRYRPDLGGGALLDVGFYPVHAAQMFLQPPLRVVGSALQRASEPGVDIAGHAVLLDTHGRTAELTFGFIHSYRSTYSLWGSTGRIVLDRAFTPPPHWSPILRIEQQDRLEQLTLAPADQFLNAVDFFARAALTGKDHRHMEQTLSGMHLLDSIRSQARPT